MGSGLISRKDSLEQLRWKEDDTDFIDFFFWKTIYARMRGYN